MRKWLGASSWSRISIFFTSFCFFPMSLFIQNNTKINSGHTGWVNLYRYLIGCRSWFLILGKIFYEASLTIWIHFLCSGNRDFSERVFKNKWVGSKSVVVMKSGLGSNRKWLVALTKNLDFHSFSVNCCRETFRLSSFVGHVYDGGSWEKNNCIKLNLICWI